MFSPARGKCSISQRIQPWIPLMDFFPQTELFSHEQPRDSPHSLPTASSVTPFLTPKGLCRKTGLFHHCRACLGRLLRPQGKSNSASPDMSAEGTKAPSPWNWGPITSKTAGFEAFGYLAKNNLNHKTCFLQTTRKLACLGPNHPSMDSADKHHVRVCTSFG